MLVCLLLISTVSSGVSPVTLSAALFTQPVQGGNAAPLFRLAVLYKRWTHSGGRVSGIAGMAEQGADVIRVAHHANTVALCWSCLVKK